MPKSQKSDPEKQHSQPLSRKLSPGAHHRKKKHPSRQITHYFNRIEQPQLIKSHQNPPNERQRDQREQILNQRKDDTLLRMTSMKQKHSLAMQRVKAIMVKQLKNMAQLQRITARHEQTVINHKRNTIKGLEYKIEDSQKLIDGGIKHLFQRFFLEKEFRENKQKLSKLRSQLRQLLDRQHILQEEETSYLSKAQWPLLSKRYQPIQLIGKGGFSQVYLAYDLECHRQIALKLSDVEHLLSGRGNKESYLRHIKRQYEVHKRLSHPNIVQLIQVIEVENAICLMMQHCQGPTLAHILSNAGTLSEEEAKGIASQLLEVIVYISRQKVVHYDLKPQNVMFQHGLLKVLDFGICKTFDSEHSKMALTSQGMGTFCYLPPQTFSNNPLLTNKIDIWSLGVIFFQMLYGTRPNHSYLNPLEQIQFPKQKQVSQPAKLFIRQCLSINLQSRLDPEIAQKHIYFQ